MGPRPGETGTAVSLAPGTCWTQGHPLPEARVGELRDGPAAAADGAELGRRFTADGYVFLRGVLDAAHVRAARVEVFERLVHSSLGRVRLSCDVRYQPAAEPIDARYFGPNPGGTTGVGYGELNGAKPLTQAWHIR